MMKKLYKPHNILHSQNESKFCNIIRFTIAIRNIIKTFIYLFINNNKVLIFKRNKVQRTLWSNMKKSPCNC